MAGGFEIQELTRTPLPLEHAITLRDLRSRIDGQDVHFASCACGWTGKQRRGPMSRRLARHDGTRHLARRKGGRLAPPASELLPGVCRHEAVEARHAGVIRGAWNAHWPSDWELQALGWCPACERLVSRRRKTAPHQSFRWKALPRLEDASEPVREVRLDDARTRIARRR